MSADHDSRRAREDARNEHRLRLVQRPWPSGPLGEALFAVTVRLQALQMEEARRGTSLMLRDPRELAGMLVGLGKAGQLEGLASTFETAAAISLAGLVSACRVEEFDPSPGGEAA